MSLNPARNLFESEQLLVEREDGLLNLLVRVLEARQAADATCKHTYKDTYKQTYKDTYKDTHKDTCKDI